MAVPKPAAEVKDMRNPDRLRSGRTGGADAAREAQLQRLTRKAFAQYAASSATGCRGAAHHDHCGAPLDLVPEQPGFIVVIPQFFSSMECAQLRTIIDTIGLNPPNGADLNPRKNEAFLKRRSLSFVDPHLCASLRPAATQSCAGFRQ